MVYVIPDTSLKVSLNTNKTVHHIIHNSWNIVDSGVNTNKNGHRHFQQCVRYNVLHGDQFYWCLTTLSTICQVLRITWSPVLFVFSDTFNNVSGITYYAPIKLVTMLYVITNTLLKVSLNTNKTVRHIIHNSWNIVDSVINTNKNGHHVLLSTMCQV
jgi:hypothetical protein